MYLNPKCLKNYSHIIGISFFVLFFSISIANAKSAPDSFADLAEKLSPSVVNKILSILSSA